MASLLATSNAAPQNTKLGITIPEECSGKGFCSIRPEGYDQIEAQIDSLVEPHLIDNDSRSVDGRIGDPYDDDDNCPSETKLESFYAYNYLTGNDTDIIVQTTLFPQRIVTVTCKHNNEQYKNLKEGGSQCFRTLGLSEFNMDSRCEESYATRTLMVYDPAMGLLKMKNFTVPVCCSCVTRKT